MPETRRTLSAFFAFPSTPEQLVETIEIGIKEVQKRKVCDILPWTSLRTTGKLVITKVLQAIDTADLVLAELAGLNPNVMFELGYAVAKKKRIWLTLDQTRKSNVDQVNGLTMLADIGYAGHANYEDICNSFMRDYPYESLDEHVLSPFDGILETFPSRLSDNDVFHLPSTLNTTPAKQLASFFKEFKARIVTDDELENSYQPLEWYLTNILSSRAVVAHLNSADADASLISNAKYSFLAGMARGFDVSVIMVAPEPFDKPFDYRGLLQTYRAGSQCVAIVKKWLIPKLAERPVHVHEPEEDATTRLMRFHIGESTAENEETSLDQYYIETGFFFRGIEDRLAVFIGRKGTGKTANLYQIRRHFSAESNDLVITVKPVSFRLEGFVRLVTEVFSERDEIDDFVERVWRVVVYSDVALELYRQIESRPSYYDLLEAEDTLMRHVEDHLDFIAADFGEKMDLILAIALDALENGLHPKSILREISSRYADPLVSIFKSVIRRFQRIVILVDNLDKAWDVHRNVTYQSQIVFGLLGFQNTVRRDLDWSDGDVRLLIFLREDIFTFVKANAREPDKIQLNVSRVSWEDPDQLARVLEERFIASTPALTNAQVWTDLFCAEVKGQSTRDYLLDHILPRPRDMIHVVRTSIISCINSGHERIEAADITRSLMTYFNFLIDNLVTEYGLYFDFLRDAIMCFIDSPDVVSYRQASRIVRPVLSNSTRAQQVMDALIHVSFLGITSDSSTTFAYSVEEAEALKARLEKGRRAFRRDTYMLSVHPAFHLELRIRTTTNEN